MSSQKWLNEIMFEKYKQIGEENDEDDFEHIDESDDEAKANLNKLDFDNDLIVLAINQQRKHFMIFNTNSANLDKNSNMAESLGFDELDRSDNRFETQLSNWLDKLTEGLNMSKKYVVKKWPNFG